MQCGQSCSRAAGPGSPWRYEQEAQLGGWVSGAGRWAADPAQQIKGKSLMAPIASGAALAAFPRLAAASLWPGDGEQSEGGRSQMYSGRKQLSTTAGCSSSRHSRRRAWRPSRAPAKWRLRCGDPELFEVWSACSASRTSAAAAMPSRWRLGGERAPRQAAPAAPPPPEDDLTPGCPRPLQPGRERAATAELRTSRDEHHRWLRSIQSFTGS